MDDMLQTLTVDDGHKDFAENRGRRRLGQSMARFATFCAMMSWVVIGVVPVAVAIYALT
ncbi:hypothetical protein [Lichenicoccus roseus]|uniref:hypothetical protein n=1 Tax=Lichenicoccus roseus TaxID=2683649 RepID=UPI001487042D|nr:hypothetical protein [Lichenicoccus roseus]